MFLKSAAVAVVLAESGFTNGEPTNEKLAMHDWRREAANPIFVPGQTYDSLGCQAPFVTRHADTYFMFYGGIDKQGRQRVCQATAPVTQQSSAEIAEDEVDAGVALD